MNCFTFGNTQIKKRTFFVIIIGILLSLMVITTHFAGDNHSSPTYIAIVIPLWLCLKPEISKGVKTIKKAE